MAARKPRYLFPGQKPPRDTTILYIQTGGPIFLGFLVFILSLGPILGLLWHNLPLFPLPAGNNWPPAVQARIFYEIILCKIFPFLIHMNFSGTVFQTIHDDYWLYARWSDWLLRNDQAGLLSYRWFLSVVSSAALGILVFKSTLTTVDRQYQSDGAILLEGDEGFYALQKDFNNQARNMKVENAYILAARKPFDPTRSLPAQNLSAADVIYMPDSQRRPHAVYVGGTRRGKTTSINAPVAQFKLENDNGGNVKMLILDTPKDDYSSRFRRSEMHLIAPHYKGAEVWDVATDFVTIHHWSTFWHNKIQDDEKNKFWSSSSRTVAIAACAVLTDECPGDYGLNNVFYTIKSIIANPLDFKDRINRLYPQASELLDLLAEPKGETRNNLTATISTNTEDLLTVSTVWDGYMEKADIHQLSVKLLKNEYENNQLLLCQALLPFFDPNEVVDGEPKHIPEHVIPNIVLRALLRAMNRNFGDGQWKWQDLAQVLNMPYREVLMLAHAEFGKDEKEVFLPPFFAPGLLDHATRAKQLKIKVQSSRHINRYGNTYFSNNRAQNYIMRALLRRYGTENPWEKIEKVLTDWTRNKPDALVEILCTCLKSYELATFSNSHTLDDHKLLLRGCKPILLRAKTWDEYEGQPRVSFTKWILDECPDKKYFVFSQSGDFQKITTTIMRACMAHLTNIVLSSNMPDDRSLGIVRKFYVILDEFQALGNLQNDVERWLALFASRGVSIWIACQDFSQLVALYKKEFVDFITSNTGNLFFFGSNMGETAKAISNLLGNKKLNKQHLTYSTGADGKVSFSDNWQTHDDTVIHPSAINRLGLDINGDYKQSSWQKFVAWLISLDSLKPHKNFVEQLLGKAENDMQVRCLYMPANSPRAYLLSNALFKSGPSLFKSKAADWTHKNPAKPKDIDTDDLASRLSDYPPKLADETSVLGDEDSEEFHDFSVEDSAPELTDEERAAMDQYVSDVTLEHMKQEAAQATENDGLESNPEPPKSTPRTPAEFRADIERRLKEETT